MTFSPFFCSCAQGALRQRAIWDALTAQKAAVVIHQASLSLQSSKLHNVPAERVGGHTVLFLFTITTLVGWQMIHIFIKFSELCRWGLILIILWNVSAVQRKIFNHPQRITHQFSLLLPLNATQRDIFTSSAWELVGINKEECIWTLPQFSNGY